MATGTVKWFNATKDLDLFSPTAAARTSSCTSRPLKAGLSSLNEGAKVSYEEMENRGKTSAENLRVG